MWCDVRIFFLKNKTAYEISACLVGSGMCVRDRSVCVCVCVCVCVVCVCVVLCVCLLYTFDAADEEDRVPLPSRRVLP